MSGGATSLTEPELDEADVDDQFLADTTPSFDPTIPRQRRAVAQPLRLENNPRVICYLHQHTQSGSSCSWHGHEARLCYFLPESWSPAYKFTVFEDSYIVQFDEDVEATYAAELSNSGKQFHLARPFHTKKNTLDGGGQLAEFEMVWPVPVDRMLLDAVQRACESVHPGAKRKPRHALSLSTVHLKMQKLDL